MILINAVVDTGQTGGGDLQSVECRGSPESCPILRCQWRGPKAPRGLWKSSEKLEDADTLETTFQQLPPYTRCAHSPGS